jgi:SNF2 family DNA or RNA helicase
MSVSAPEAIRTLNRLMQAICLRRTKDVVLSLCPKVEQVVCVNLSSKWQPLSEQMHDTFSRSFGRMRNSAEPWDFGEFFWQLGLIRQFCNHPIFVREGFGLDVKWRCSQSAKVVHLINNLKQGRPQDEMEQSPKCVVFSNYVSFLEM